MTDDYDIPVVRGMGGRGGPGRRGMGMRRYPMRGGYPMRRGGRFGVFPFFLGPWTVPWIPPVYQPYPCYTYDAYGRCTNPYDRYANPVVPTDAEAEFVSSGYYDYDLDDF